jgi:hypothetical protein
VLTAVLQFVFLIAIGYFLGRSIADSWSSVRAYHWSPKWALLVVSFLGEAALMVLLPLGAYRVLSLMGFRMKFSRLFRAYFLSQVAKYLPGGFWALLGRGYYYSREGISTASTMVLLFVEITTSLVAGVMVFALSFPFWTEQSPQPRMVLVTLLVPIGFLVLHPKHLKWLSNRLLRRISRDPIEVPFNYTGLLQCLGIYFVFWSCSGLMFWVFCEAVVPGEVPVAVGMGVLPGAWAIGLMSIVTPGGLGVREGAMAVFLSYHVPKYHALVISLAARVWWTFAELLCLMAVGFWVVVRKLRRR